MVMKKDTPIFAFSSPVKRSRRMKSKSPKRVSRRTSSRTNSQSQKQNMILDLLIVKIK